VCVCVCVCVCACNQSNHFLCTKYLQKLVKFCGGVRRGPGRNRLNFRVDPDSFTDSG